MKIDEWPFTEGDFRLFTPRMGNAGWYFCPFDASEWILVSEDPSAALPALVETLKLEMSLRASEKEH